MREERTRVHAEKESTQGNLLHFCYDGPTLFFSISVSFEWLLAKGAAESCGGRSPGCDDSGEGREEEN